MNDRNENLPVKALKNVLEIYSEPESDTAQTYLEMYMICADVLIAFNEAKRQVV